MAIPEQIAWQKGNMRMDDKETIAVDSDLKKAP